MTTSRHPAAVVRIAAPGEGLCLDFVNTCYWRGSPVPTDELTGFPALVGWLGARGGFEPQALKPFAGLADAEPAKAGKLFAQAVTLREAIHGLFAATASEAPLPAADFAALNAALAVAPTRRALAPAGGGWQAALPDVSAAALLAPVLWSAADLLLARGERRIRQCANKKCRFLFIDESKNGTRRWCDMSSCGNRAKAHRHLLKKKRG